MLILLSRQNSDRCCPLSMRGRWQGDKEKVEWTRELRTTLCLLRWRCWDITETTIFWSVADEVLVHEHKACCLDPSSKMTSFNTSNLVSLFDKHLLSVSDNITCAVQFLLWTEWRKRFQCKSWCRAWWAISRKKSVKSISNCQQYGDLEQRMQVKSGKCVFSHSITMGL